MGFVVTSIFTVVDPLTRRAPAGDDAGGAPPSPPRGRGSGNFSLDSRVHYVVEVLENVETPERG
jgi:hypothetical protein